MPNERPATVEELERAQTISELKRAFAQVATFPVDPAAQLAAGGPVFYASRLPGGARIVEKDGSAGADVGVSIEFPSSQGERGVSAVTIRGGKALAGKTVEELIDLFGATPRVESRRLNLREQALGQPRVEDGYQGMVGTEEVPTSLKGMMDATLARPSDASRLSHGYYRANAGSPDEYVEVELEIFHSPNA